MVSKVASSSVFSRYMVRPVAAAAKAVATAFSGGKVEMSVNPFTEWGSEGRPISLLDKRADVPRHSRLKWSRRKLSDIKGLCIHQTLGGDDPVATANYHVNYFNNGSKTPGAPSVCYTFYIRRSGDIWMCNDLEDITWSQGTSKIPGDENLMYLSIVLGGHFNGTGYNGGVNEPTLLQMKALLELIDFLCVNLGLGYDQVFGHYDFGKPACVSGDTEIPLLDGTKKTAAELAESGERSWFYSCSPEGVVVPGGPSFVRRTGTSREVLKVTLDNGKSITCTPDHLFMLRDGSYITAEELRPGSSLMPLYRAITPGGYEVVMDPSTRKYRMTHRMVASSVQLSGFVPEGQKQVIHHRSLCKTNNIPSELVVMGDRDHIALHASLGSYYMSKNWENPEFRARAAERAAELFCNSEMRAKSSAALKERFEDPQFAAEFSRKASVAAKKRWDDPAYREAVSAAGTRTLDAHRDSADIQLTKNKRAAGIRARWEDEEFRSKHSCRLAKEVEANWCREEYRDKMVNAVKESNIRRLTKKCEDVYNYIIDSGDEPDEAAWEQARAKFGRFTPRFETASRYIGGLVGPNNHTVVSIDSAGVQDVYDVINCAPYNNFGLVAGVFVHNCPGFTISGIIEAINRDPSRTSDTWTAFDWQYALVRLGYDLGAFGKRKDGVDGDWGSSSRTALTSYQMSKKLQYISGLRDAKTKQLLIEDLKAKFGADVVLAWS